MAKERRKKLQPLKYKVQTSLIEREYNAVKMEIFNRGESKVIREMLQFALKNGYLESLKKK